MVRKSKRAIHCNAVGVTKGNRDERRGPSNNTKKASTTTSKPPKKTAVSPRKSDRLNPPSPSANKYIIANVGQVEDLFHSGYLSHQSTSPRCKGKLHMIQTDNRIISISFKLECALCKFFTLPQKLYKEKKVCCYERRRASTLNLSLGH